MHVYIQHSNSGPAMSVNCLSLCTIVINIDIIFPLHAGMNAIQNVFKVCQMPYSN